MLVDLLEDKTDGHNLIELDCLKTRVTALTCDVIRDEGDRPLVDLDE